MAIVLLSGGQDSTTALLWALRELREPLYALTFLYGQRHAIEIQAAKQIAEKLRVAHYVLDLGALWESLAVPSALTREQPIEMLPTGLPSTFVPGRNLFLLSAAAVWGYPRGETSLIMGVNQIDYSGYPDCRAPFLEAAEEALKYALDSPIRIIAPFLFWDKARLWQYAKEIGYLDFIVEETHTCYLGERAIRHVWGYGCGTCAACHLRKVGYEQAFG
ncbi:MAG: 7-cyano-7-deazaguanine synthase QueC [Bacteroidia bacterium]|nr:7-cyano-7-deazaguanine synthase QueC [Bacteroidia bacterium]MDW8134236.1 7-cyano-7-deazaguanine synthase QueC [Bacteroidia bacterium]